MHCIDAKQSSKWRRRIFGTEATIEFNIVGLVTLQKTNNYFCQPDLVDWLSTSINITDSFMCNDHDIAPIPVCTRL